MSHRPTPDTSSSRLQPRKHAPRAPCIGDVGGVDEWVSSSGRQHRCRQACDADSRETSRVTGLGTGIIGLVTDGFGTPIGYRWRAGRSDTAHATTMARGRPSAIGLFGEWSFPSAAVGSFVSSTIVLYTLCRKPIRPRADLEANVGGWDSQRSSREPRLGRPGAPAILRALLLIAFACSCAGEPANDPKQSSFAIVDGMLDDAHQAVVGIFAGNDILCTEARVAFQFRHRAPWDRRASLTPIARADGALSATRRRLESAPTCAASTFDQTNVQPAVTAYATSKVEERVSPRSTMAPSRAVAPTVRPASRNSFSR